MELRTARALVGEPRPEQRIELRTEYDRFTFINMPHCRLSNFTWRLERQREALLLSLFPGLVATWDIVFDASYYTIYLMARPVHVGGPLTLAAVPQGFGYIGETGVSEQGEIVRIKVLN